MKHSKLKYRFNQLADTNKHQLYIYDDVTAHGSFNWDTWEYDKSETSAEYFREKLDEIPDTDEIELYVNSYGGSVKEGVAIYNMLSRKKCKKTCYVDGFAYSVASLICLSCDKIVMGLGTTMMIHDMWMTVSGNARELRRFAEDLDTMMESNRKIYMKRAKNLTEDELIEMMANETKLTPEQCLHYGFCDEISNMTINEKEIVQAERKVIMNMKKEMLLQKSIREEMIQFIKKANDIEDKNTEIEDNTQQKDSKQQEPSKTNIMGSFFNAISK